MMEVVVTTGAIRRAKLQSNCHHQQTNVGLLMVTMGVHPVLFKGRMPFLNQQCLSAVIDAIITVI